MHVMSLVVVANVALTLIELTNLRVFYEIHQQYGEGCSDKFGIVNF